MIHLIINNVITKENSLETSGELNLVFVGNNYILQPRPLVSSNFKFSVKVKRSHTDYKLTWRTVKCDT